MSEPQIFDSVEQLQSVLGKHVLAYRRDLAMRFRLIAAEYEQRAADKMHDHVYSAWAEGVAEGLRVAAAKVDPEP